MDFNYSTSPQQTVRLLSLGLSPETADNSWHAPEGDVPSWSVTALMDFLPAYIEDDYRCYPLEMAKFSNGRYTLSYSTKYTIKHNVQGTLMEVAFGMLVWLLENNIPLINNKYAAV